MLHPREARIFNIHKLINVICHINKLKKKQANKQTDMIISVGAEKVLTKFSTQYNKCSPEHGHRRNIPQYNKVHI